MSWRTASYLLGIAALLGLALYLVTGGPLPWGGENADGPRVGERIEAGGDGGSAHSAELPLHLEGRRGSAGDTPTSGAVTPPEATTITLLGFVFDDEEAEPLAGVRVRLGRVPSPARSARLEKGDEPSDWFLEAPVTVFVEERVTGDDGAFSFSLAGPRGWAIHATKEGFSGACVDTRHWVVDPGETEAPFEIYLGRGTGVRWQVVDVLDRPVQGAAVSQYTDLDSGPPSVVVHTDREGWFEITAAEGDELLVRADGYARRIVRYILERVDAPIVLTEARTLGGVVVDEADRPIEGALVSVVSEAVSVRVTDAQGRFAWDDLTLEPQQDRVHIDAARAGYLRGWAYVTVGRTDVRIVMARPGVVSGRFQFPDGVDPTPVQLRLDGPSNYVARCKVEIPEFRVERVPPGHLLLTASAHRPLRVHGQDHAVLAFRGEVRVDRSPGCDLEGVVVVLESVPTSYVVLRVMDTEGHPVAGAMHFADTPYGGAHARRTNGAGIAWSARAVSVGTRTKASASAVISVHDGTRSVASEPVPVRTVADPESEPVDIVLDLDPAGGASSVRLILFTERADGVPLSADAGANWRVGQHSNPLRGRNPEVTGPGASGGRWRGVLPIQAGLASTVLAWAKGCAQRRFALPPFLAGETIEFVCRLEPESRVRGRLVTPTGRAARGYSVRADSRPPGELPVRTVRYEDDIAPDGAFVLDRVPAGPAYISVARPDGVIVAELTRDVPAGATLDCGELVLGSLPRLRGTVRDPDGRALGGALIELLEIGQPEPYLRSSTNGEGRFEFAAPLRKNAVMRVSRGEFAPHYARLDPACFDAPQDVRLLPPGTVVVESSLPPASITSWWLSVFEGTYGHAFGFRGSGSRVDGGLRWTLRGMPIGPIRLELIGRRADGSPWRSEVKATVVSGRTTTVGFEHDE